MGFRQFWWQMTPLEKHAGDISEGSKSLALQLCFQVVSPSLVASHCSCRGQVMSLTSKISGVALLCFVGVASTLWGRGSEHGGRGGLPVGFRQLCLPVAARHSNRARQIPGRQPQAGGAMVHALRLCCLYFHLLLRYRDIDNKGEP